MIAKRHRSTLSVVYVNPQNRPKREFRLDRVRTESGFTQYLVTRVSQAYPLVRANQFTLEIRR